MTARQVRHVQEFLAQPLLNGAPLGVVVRHGAVAGTARPATADAVHWIGSVEPANALSGDIWTSPASSPANFLPGQEIAYSERLAADTTTNTNAAAATSNKIPGLSIQVTGTGTPIQVEFDCVVRHSVATGEVAMWFVVDGVLSADPGAFAQVPARTVGRDFSMHASMRMVVPVGVTRTIEVGKWISGAGTATYNNPATNPMYLVATQR